MIECETEGKTHDYRRKKGLEANEMVVPDGTPKWGRDRGQLWNGAELAERNGRRGANAGKLKANARTAREAFFSFPAELSEAGRLKVARIVAGHLVEKHQVGAEFSIHQPGRDGDERNYHCHLLMTTRRLTAKGFGEKAREWDDQKTGPALTRALRVFIADMLNVELKAESKSNLVHVEHRSFADRGSSQKPQQHQGPGKTHQQRKQQGQARRAWFGQAQREQRDRQGKELASLSLRQDFGMQAKLTDFDRRERDGTRAIKAELDQQRRQDAAPDGVRRAFLAVTSRVGREAFNREGREAERVQASQGKLDALKIELQVERNGYAAGQTKERAELIERHGAEGRQLSQALASRESLDRSTEVVGRREQVQGRDKEHERQQEQGRGGRSIGPSLSLH